ncbi:DUF1214 domain-containing protein [Hyphomonas sp.]|uniref:DUF1214 domain-containing protein n=1 Tax=Hyphomonas sp. TaxID=87 RepID=UPI00391C0F51
MSGLSVSPVKTLMALLIGAILGLAAGAGSAMWIAGAVGPGVRIGGGINAGGWKSDWTIGSPAANPWTRARVARHGLLALSKEEAVYFTRNTDDTGERLQEACTYRVTGIALPALWWSLTLYDATSFLPQNSDNALSFDRTDADTARMGEAWSFLIAPERPDAGGPWVSSRAAGNFDLTLRLYKPAPDLIAAPLETLPPPAITRLSCRSAP